jgi:pyruvate/2-oxoglutarate dehydrogenase complex dihydrolipoamide acyltransferase (E2) component
VSQRKPGYRDLPFPDAQRQGVDWHSIMTSRNTIHGLVELDITETRKAIHRYRRAAGEPLSFTALIVASFAHVVGVDPSVQALRRGRNRVVVFDDVDVTVLVEQVLDGERIPIPHIVRAANRKTPSEVDREIRAAKASTDPYARARRFEPIWLLVPARIRRFAISTILASPHRRKRYTGTATVTAVGMFGSGLGWGIPFIGHSIGLTMGGVGRRPGFGPDGGVESREYVSLTVSVDHDVVNGAPVARFISRFRESVESASLLQDGVRTTP